MKLIYTVLALAATVIAAPALVKRDNSQQLHPRAEESWSGDYDDTYDDDKRGHKILEDANPSTPCEEGTATRCSPVDLKTGARDVMQCQGKKWVLRQCDFGFNCGVSKTTGEIACVSAGHK
ncbi:hypothetical protein BDR26DRAFT_857278 [Obelidium mucronatum]|nr:hypothetical protein BDR26DRAFT_857278 [Obelidium mucronatum]